MQYSFLIADLMFLLVPFAVAVYGNNPESLDDITFADDAPFGWNSFVYGLQSASSRTRPCRPERSSG